jgi:hypothetical protein
MTEWVTDKLFDFKKVSTKANYADLFTKPLNNQTFQEFRKKFMVETNTSRKPGDISDGQELKDEDLRSIQI